MSRPKLTDVAKLAGVSLGTASQALNNKGNLLPETRERVLQAATDLGYQMAGRGSASHGGAMSMLGIVLRNNLHEEKYVNPFYSHVLAGAERECQRQNLSLMYASIKVDENSHAVAFPLMLLEQQVDGLIVVGAFLEETLTEISKKTNIPIVLVDGYTSANSYDSIVTDNINGAYVATSYLIEQGHQHIALLGSSPAAYPSILERRKGYQLALADHGLTPHIFDSPLERETTYNISQTIIKNHPEITAIFACNDDIAIGVIHAANDMGLEIPDDLSVVGFDDIELAQEIIPALTTMHVDKVLMGALGVRHILNRANDPQHTVITTSLSTQLIVRSSVRNLHVID